MNTAAGCIELSDRDAELLLHCGRLVGEMLGRLEARKIGPVGKMADGSDVAHVEMPPGTMRVLSQILPLLARHQITILYSGSSELTIKQSATVLGVSLPFVTRVLEAGEIPCRKLGPHRRVLMRDVLAYKQTMQVKSRTAMDELVKLSEETGLYDLG